MSIGERIKSLRETRLKLTGTEFGVLCDVSKGMVSSWEKNRNIPSIEKILKLQKNILEEYKIHFSLDWLYNGEERGLEESANKPEESLLDMAISLLSVMDEDDYDVWKKKLLGNVEINRAEIRAAANKVRRQQEEDRAGSKKPPDDLPKVSRRTACS